MYGYDRVVSEVNKICDTDCWENPKKECKYYCVCKMRIEKNEKERTEEFESAMIARYNELHKTK